MNKPLLISLAAATILTSSLSAESMYDRIQGMELKMKQMQEEISTLKASDKDEAEEESSVSDDEESDDEDSAEDSDDDGEESDDDDDEEMSVEEQLEEIDESIFELNKLTNGNKLKLSADYRYTYENLQYKMADGSERSNNGLMTNRLWINMNWKANDNLSFSGQLAYNSTFGQRSGASMPQSNSAEGFDWVTNENANDNAIRLKSAYFLYKNDTFLGSDVPWTFSIGRRPSTNGHLINLRDDDGAASPMGHAINVEFDGLSSKFAFEELTGVEGMYIKLCAGRGMTNATPKFSPAPYETTNDTQDLDMVGFILVPYDDGKYAVASQYTYANNLIDVNNMMDMTAGFKTVGDLETLTANFTVNGLGNEWSDYLDDTMIFVSGAMSVTHPNTYGGGMIGSTESKTGYSVWAGIQMPSVVTEDGKWGIEYNQGDQYWRSITYAEDTNIGSKIGARGEAYEIYFNEPLVEDILTFQMRFTHIDYKYTGSNGFFGSTTGSSMAIADVKMGAAMGDPMASMMAPMIVESAQDIRFYLRYRY